MSKSSTKISRNWLRQFRRRVDKTYYTNEDWTTLAKLSLEKPYNAMRLKLPVYSLSAGTPVAMNSQHARARRSQTVQLRYSPDRYFGYFFHVQKQKKVVYGELHEYREVSTIVPEVVRDEYDLPHYLPQYMHVLDRYFYLMEIEAGEWELYAAHAIESELIAYLLENWD